MRIAFDYQAFVEQQYGGISRYFVRLAQELVENKQKVGIFSPLHRNIYLTEIGNNICKGHYVKDYIPRTGRLFRFYNMVRSRDRIAKWAPDIIHETYYSKTSSANGKCPLIITVYDMIHEHFTNERSRFTEIINRKRIAIKRADHVICISQSTKKDLVAEMGLNEKNISVIYLGYDQLERQFGLVTEEKIKRRPYILYVGGRDWYKNFQGFLKAVASSKRLIRDFDIVAFGGPAFSNTELSLIHTLGFQRDQVRHQNGSDSILSDLYYSALAFVYPSMYEGFGIPPLEAMAHNCPVVCSNVSSIPEIVQNAGEYFDPYNMQSIKHAIENVVYSNSKIENLKREGLIRIKQFSWNKCMEETLNVYKSIIINRK